jgi:hypothetical protein
VSANWRNDVVALSALYLMLERGQTLKSEGKLSNPIFVQMEKAGLITDMGLEYEVTDVGREAVKRAVAAQDVLRQMEIFACVDVTRALTQNEASPFADEAGQVRAEVWDPRFAADNPNAFDMRLAVITWLGETVTKKPVVPETIVFLQKLGSGQLSIELFWSDVRKTLDEVEAVVASAYKWQDAAPGDVQAADKAMRAIYAAGQLEQRKREGTTCGGCGIPLVVFEQQAAARGEDLGGCPECLRIFPPAEATGLSCPKCKSVIYEDDAHCGGCGATIDFSLPTGTVQTDTTETITTEPVWSSSYGYVSYGWLDPWNPIADAVALSYLCYDPFWI